MQSLRELISRIRDWRLWRALGRSSRLAAEQPEPLLLVTRPILREVTAQGVRVYSLCGSCGAHLAASATLCEACARARGRPASR